MIQINLLPKELRKAEPTPWPKLLALLISLMVILASALLMIYFRFNLLSQAMEERRVAEEEKKGLEALAKEADELEEKIKSHELHKRTIEDIGQTRWLWAKKLDQIVDIIPADVQIDSLEVKPSRASGAGGSKQEQGPEITMNCLLDGRDERNISKFRRKIISSPLWEDILDMPEWPYSLESGKDKRDALKFKAVFVLKPKLPVKPTKEKEAKPQRGAPPKAPRAG